jgi:hypothetical protein
MMKIKVFIALILGFGIVSSCNKKADFNYPAGTVGISKITNFPVLTMNGSKYITVPVGGTYTEPGATAKEGENDLTVTVDGAVDVSTPGVYDISYSAVNKDGFSALVRRFVAVYETDPEAAGHDLSGNYLRAVTGITNTWEKIAPGVYLVDNPGGAAGVNLQVILFNPTGYVIEIPEQVSSDGSITASNTESYDPGPPATYSMAIENPTYGTQVRFFEKQ